jgi:hypothetical protein
MAYMKRFTSVLLCLFSLTLTAQNFEDEWEGHFSYVSVTSISQGNDRVYAASENAVFTFDLSTREIETKSTVNGLSGETISTIYYSEEFNLLVIGYETGLIEIVLDGDENVRIEVGILEELNVPPNVKHINHFYEFDGKLYISAGYGISVYDLALLEFIDTYFIGNFGSQINVNQITVVEPYIYAATTGNGVRKAMVNDDNLIDFNAWTNIAGGLTLKGIQEIGGEIYTIDGSNKVFLVLNFLQFVTQINGDVQDFTSKDEVLVITTTESIQAYGNGFSPIASVNSLSGFEYVLQSGYAFNNIFYLGTTEIGMLSVPFGASNGEQILPDGPLLNHPFAVDASPGQLWTSFGEIDVNFNPFPLNFRGISYLRAGQDWLNIPEEEVLGASDIVHVKINPENTSEVYMSSFQKGLLKVVDQVPVKIYNQTSSPPIQAPPNLPNAEVRIYGADFDREGNLWMVQTFTNDGLLKLTPNDQIQAIDISGIIDGETDLGLSKLDISREGFVFFGSSRDGLIGYDPGTGRFNKIQEGVGSGNLPTTNVRAVAFDVQNRLWIGTLRGLRVLFNVSSFFDEGENTDAQPIIILEDGVPQELLFEQSITDIEVDGSNNKWIATATSGVFYLSPNGQETLLRFTKSNSPLPSNNVLDISIDGDSGVVYFATENGLVAFKGTSTAPKDNLENVYAYPNPVRPGFLGNVTVDGLTAKANVKITDIEGNIVFEETSQGGSVSWDTTAFGKYRVASGVYLILVTTDDATETTVSKVMIVR